MPPRTAERLRRVVSRQRATWLAANVAIALAIVCVPLGLVTADVAGLPGWVVTMAAWLACVTLAGVLRASRRKALAAELAAAKHAWQLEASNARPSAGLRSDAEESADSTDVTAARGENGPDELRAAQRVRLAPDLDRQAGCAHDAGERRRVEHEEDDADAELGSDRDRAMGQRNAKG